MSELSEILPSYTSNSGSVIPMSLTLRAGALLLLPLLTVLGCSSSAPPSTAPVVTAAIAGAPSSASEPRACDRAMVSLFATLRSPVHIDAYVPRGLPKVDAFVKSLREALIHHADASKGMLDVRIIDSMSEGARESAKNAGLEEIAFAKATDEAAQTTGFLGLAFAYSGEKETIPMLLPEDRRGIDFWIGSTIRELQGRAHHLTSRFGVLTGKKELKLSEQNLLPRDGDNVSPSILSVFNAALPIYKFEDVDLRRGDASIKTDLDGLLITQPGEALTERELRRIDQFLMLGNKALVIFAGAVNIKPYDPSMSVEFDTRGLTRLLDGYGIEMKSDTILDWWTSMGVETRTGAGESRTSRLPSIVVTTDPLAPSTMREGDNGSFLDGSFIGFFRLSPLSFPFPSTLVPHPEKQPDARMRVVARSTSKATAEAPGSLSLKALSELKPQGEQRERAMAIALEGRVRSAFAGVQEAGVDAPAESSGRARVLVLASPQFLTNPLARAGNTEPLPPQMAMMSSPSRGNEGLRAIGRGYARTYLTLTISALKKTLDWAVIDDDLAACIAEPLER